MDKSDNFDIFHGLEKYRERNAVRVEKLKEIILKDSVWLTEEDLIHRNNQLTKKEIDIWKHENKIFGLEKDGLIVFPEYIFDENAHPIASVKKVLDIFDNKKKDWNIVFWFESLNSWLGNIKPKDALREEDKLIFAATREKEGVLHG